MVAEQLGRFVFRERVAPDPPPVDVDVEMLIGAMETRMEEARAELDALGGLPRLEVTYEEDLLDQTRHQSTLDRLSDGLGLPEARASTNVRRITQDDLRSTIANYEEVEAALRETRWHGYLSE
jgi:hypothetical protein